MNQDALTQEELEAAEVGTIVVTSVGTPWEKIEPTKYGWEWQHTVNGETFHVGTSTMAAHGVYKHPAGDPLD